MVIFRDVIDIYEVTATKNDVGSFTEVRNLIGNFYANVVVSFDKTINRDSHRVTIDTLDATVRVEVPVAVNNIIDYKETEYIVVAVSDNKDKYFYKDIEAIKLK